MEEATSPVVAVKHEWMSPVPTKDRYKYMYLVFSLVLREQWHGQLIKVGDPVGVCEQIVLPEWYRNVLLEYAVEASR